MIILGRKQERDNSYLWFGQGGNKSGTPTNSHAANSKIIIMRSNENTQNKRFLKWKPNWNGMRYAILVLLSWECVCNVCQANHDFFFTFQRIRHYMDWSVNTTQFLVLKEIHSTFLECFLTTAAATTKQEDDGKQYTL